jgi:uncharacterized lipoprotein YajG
MEAIPKGAPAMKKLLVASAITVLAAGCATQADQYAQADCKVAPITTASAAGKVKPASSIEQRYAEMQLASTDYRYRQLAQRGRAGNNVEDALQDCATK